MDLRKLKTLIDLVSESGVAAGTRRIEAVTGWNAYGHAVEQRAELDGLSALLKARPGQLAERVQALHSDVKKLRKASEKAAASPATPPPAITTSVRRTMSGV